MHKAQYASSFYNRTMHHILVTLLLLSSMAFAPNETTLADWIRYFKATSSEIEEILEKGIVPDSLKERIELYKLNVGSDLLAGLTAAEIDRGERAIQDLVKRPTATQRRDRFEIQKNSKVDVLKPIISTAENPSTSNLPTEPSYLPQLKKLLKEAKSPGVALHDFIDHLDTKPHEGPVFEQTIQDLGEYLKKELSMEIPTLSAQERLVIAEAITRLEFLSRANKKASNQTINSWNTIHQFNKGIYIQLLSEAKKTNSPFKAADVVRIISGRLKHAKTERDVKLGNILREGFDAIAQCKPPQSQADFIKAILRGTPLLAFDKATKAQGLANAIIELASETGMNPIESRQMIRNLIKALDYELETLRDSAELHYLIQDHLDLIEQCKSKLGADTLALELIKLPKKASREEIMAALTTPLEPVTSRLAKLKQLYQEHPELLERSPAFMERILDAVLSIGTEPLSRVEAQEVRDFYQKIHRRLNELARENLDRNHNYASTCKKVSDEMQRRVTILNESLKGNQNPVIMINPAPNTSTSSVPPCLQGASALGRLN